MATASGDLLPHIARPEWRQHIQLLGDSSRQIDAHCALYEIYSTGMEPIDRHKQISILFFPNILHRISLQITVRRFPSTSTKLSAAFKIKPAKICIT